MEAESDTIHCKLCLSDWPASESQRLQTCPCVFCLQCLRQYVQLAIRGGAGSDITCPDPSCVKNGTLLDSEIASLATAEQVQLYRRLRFERGVQLDPSRSWCPVLDCQAVCQVSSGTEGRPAPVPCPACHAVFCRGCRGPWEEGHACSPLQPLVMDSDTLIKACPACGVFIERNQGCAQMLCKSCKHTFCWYCLRSLDGDIFLRHYDKGPCRNKLGHSRASVMWNRTQVVGILLGISLVVLVTSPLLLLASPCILCCVCKPRQAHESDSRRKEKKKKPPDYST